MKRCPTCGAINVTSAQVCSACGHSFQTQFSGAASATSIQAGPVNRDFEYWVKCVWAIALFSLGAASAFYWVRVAIAAFGGDQPVYALRALAVVPPELIALPIVVSLGTLSFGLIWLYRINGRTFIGSQKQISTMLAISAALCALQFVGRAIPTKEESKVQQAVEATVRDRMRAEVRLDPRLAGIEATGAWATDLIREVGQPDRQITNGLVYGTSVVWLTDDGRVWSIRAYLKDEVPTRRPDPKQESNQS